MHSLTVIGLFLCVLRAVLAAIAVIGAIWASRVRAVGPAAQGQPILLEESERRIPLVVLAGGALAVLVVASWPLLYVVLQSYVPQRADAMCMYGVTQIGRGYSDWRGTLPALLRASEMLKPVVVLLAGAWVVWQLATRRSASSGSSKIGLLWLGALAVVAAADAGLEGAWLVTPNPPPCPQASACCTAPPPSAVNPTTIEPWMSGCLSAGLLAGLHALAWCAACGMTLAWPRLRARVAGWSGAGWRIAATVVALACVVSGMALFSQVVAPWLTGLPEHRCLYCLLATRPVAIVTGVLLIAGGFLPVWGASCPTPPATSDAANAPWEIPHRLFAAGRWCLVVYAAMLGWELWLAR
jgi:hypothetical protein